MADSETIQFFFNNVFSIGVAIYLLYERAKFNEKITQTLERITVLIESIENRVK